MDIQYLLFLQTLRQSMPYAVEEAFVGISFIADGPILVAFALVVYWCINKRAGQLSFTAFSLGFFSKQLIKNIACIYRPWMNNPAIQPTQIEIADTSGYSFPSGHTTIATSVFGGLAWFYRKQHRWVVVISVLMIMLIAFSRNFLGLHTPQDVLVGMLLGILSIVVAQAFINWIEKINEKNPNHKLDIAVMIVVIIVCVVSLIFVVSKSYPLNYVNGQLIVDPQLMIKESFEAAGVMSGLVIGWVCERRLVRFSTDNISRKTRILRCVIGIAAVGVVYVGSSLIFKALIGALWSKMCVYFLVVLFGIFLIPLLFSHLERHTQASEQAQKHSGKHANTTK